MKKTYHWVFLTTAICLAATIAGIMLKKPEKIDVFSEVEFLSQQQNIKSLVALPSGYNQQDNKKWPLVLFLHGSWHRGSNVNLVRRSGLPSLIDDGIEYPFIVVAPQCPAEKSWDPQQLMNLISEAEKRYQVDPSRIHVTGFELGGYATWDLASLYPDRFATAVPFGGRPTDSLMLKSPEWMKALHLWHFYYASDPMVEPWEVLSVMRDLASRGYELSITDSKHHRGEIWQTWTNLYRSSRVIPWILQKEKKSKYAIDWNNTPPKPGGDVWGELVNQDSGQVLISFRCYIPTTDDSNHDLAALCLCLSDESKSKNDSIDKLTSPLSSLVATEREHPFVLISPQNSAAGEWNLNLLETLLNQINGEVSYDPNKIFLLGEDLGANAAWNLALRDSWRYAGLALFNYQPGPYHRHESHHLFRLPKWFVLSDDFYLHEIEYLQSVKECFSLSWQKHSLIIDLAKDNSDTQIDLVIQEKDKIAEWILKQEKKLHNIDRDPMLLSYMASPQSAKLFEEIEFVEEDTNENEIRTTYHFYSPKKFDDDKDYPLIVWLHGHGDSELELQGGDLKYIDLIFQQPTKPEKHNFFLLSIQCPKDNLWHGTSESNDVEAKGIETISTVMKLAEKINRHFPVDQNRISLVGISSGGNACWELMKRHPNYFSAVAPLASNGQSLKGADLSSENIWCFKGLVDPGIETLRDTVIEARQQGSSIKLSEVLVDSHDCWTSAFLEYDLLEWLLSQRRK